MKGGGKGAYDYEELVWELVYICKSVNIQYNSGASRWQSGSTSPLVGGQKWKTNSVRFDQMLCILGGRGSDLKSLFTRKAPIQSVVAFLNHFITPISDGSILEEIERELGNNLEELGYRILQVNHQFR